jgi:hypothetical protein
MSFIIFNKNLDNVNGSLYKIAENESDLNNLNIIKSDYKIIEVTTSDFNDIKLKKKFPLKYSNNVIFYETLNISFLNKEYVDIEKKFIAKIIKPFLDNNSNHVLFDKFNDYYNQLNNLDSNNIEYPLNKSLEQYFDDLDQPSLNTLQIP